MRLPSGNSCVLHIIKEPELCMSCGCRLPNTSHGDPRHITLTDLMDAGKAAGIDAMQAAENIIETMDELVGETPDRYVPEEQHGSDSH